MAERAVVVAAGELEAFAARALEACGLEPGAARAAAAVLAYADQAGMDTHGIVNLPRIYAPKLLAGEIDPRARPRVVAERGGAATIDACGGLGLVAATVAIDEAIERAREHGVGAVAVRRSSHLGTAGFYTARAAEQGMAAIVASNCGTQRIARPPGGREPMLGTNPLSAAAPARELPPFVLDMSTTVVPTGAVRQAAARGEPIPEGWLVDDDGRPVTDPAAYDEGRGHLLWLGGSPATGAYKGFALGVLVDVLAGALGGAAVGPGSPPGIGDRDVGHFMLALDVAAFRPLADFLGAMDGMLATLLACPPGGGAVRYAGHPEAEEAERRRRDGVPLAPHVDAELRALAAELSIEPLAARPGAALAEGGR